MKKNLVRSLISIVLSAFFLFCAGCSSPEEKKLVFFNKGNALFEQEEYVKARLEFKNAAQIDPKFAAAYYMLGKTEIELKNFKGAYGMLLKAVELDPDNSDARIDLGKILLAGKAIDRADEQAEAVLAKDPEHLDANLLKASVCFVNKKKDRGREILLKLRGKGEISPEMYLMLSNVARLKKDAPQMRAYLVEGLEKNPDNISLILTMAQVDAQFHDFYGAELNLKKAIALKPEAIVFKLNLARVFMAQGKKEAAQGVLTQVLEADDANQETRLTIARFWLSAKEVQTAEDLVKEGLVKMPDSFQYRQFLSEIYVGTKRLDAAEMILRQAVALSKDPAHPEIIKSKIALAKILLFKANIMEGEMLVDQVLENDPKNIDAHFLKGRLYMSRRDGGNAVPEFRIVVEDRPRMVEGHINLALAHSLNKEYALALDVLELAYGKMPTEVAVLKAMARVNMMKKDMDAAEANLVMAVEANRENLQSVIDLGDFYLVFKKYNRALEQYEIVKQKKPDHAGGYIKTASVYLSQKETKKAEEILILGYEKIPDSALIVTNLVRIYIQEKDFDSAIRLCENRLAKNESEAFTWNLLGSVCLAKSDLKGAQPAFEKAIEILPDWGKPYDSLARIYLVRGEKETAIKKFNDALAKNPNNAQAWMILGSIHERDKNYEKAAATYEQAFEKNPGIWAAANNLAVIKSEFSHSAADLEMAMEYARKAEKLNPGAGVVQDTLGWIQYKMGNLDQAYADIKKALEDLPDNSSLNYHMGVVLDRQGKPEESRLYLEKALAEETDFLGADTARKILAKYKTDN